MVVARRAAVSVAYLSAGLGPRRVIFRDARVPTNTALRGKGGDRYAETCSNYGQLIRGRSRVPAAYAGRCEVESTPGLRTRKSQERAEAATHAGIPHGRICAPALGGGAGSSTRTTWTTIRSQTTRTMSLAANTGDTLR